MASSILNIDADLLRRARIRALEQGESVNSLVRDWLEGYASGDRQRDAAEKIIGIARAAHASSGPGGRTWTREDAHDDRLSRQNPFRDGTRT